jgi:hypothetical protein
MRVTVGDATIFKDKMVAVEGSTMDVTPNRHWFRGRCDAVVARADGQIALNVGEVAWSPEPSCAEYTEVLLGTIYMRGRVPAKLTAWRHRARHIVEMVLHGFGVSSRDPVEVSSER